MATTAALASDAAARTEAQSALNAADSYVRAIQDQNPLGTSNSTFGNLALLASISHDGTLTQYYQNATGGKQSIQMFLVLLCHLFTDMLASLICKHSFKQH